MSGGTGLAPLLPAVRTTSGMPPRSGPSRSSPPGIVKPSSAWRMTSRTSYHSSGVSASWNRATGSPWPVSTSTIPTTSFR